PGVNSACENTNENTTHGSMANSWTLSDNHRWRIEESNGGTNLTAILPGAGSQNEEVRLYPNPTTGTFTLDMPRQEDGPKEVEIYDMNGRLVRSLSVSSSTSTLETAGLQKGIYVVKLKAKGRKVSKKLVVE
ncbi:MAG: T9SS type A sorting domain-containing protein, partial [Bacteroidota bacterium]